MTLTPLLWTIRFAAALGLAALSLTGEISGAYVSIGWVVWGASFLLDRRPDWQERLRAWETAAVVGLVSVFLLDFFHWGVSIFISVAHFLLLFQLFKILGLKARKDCLQILLFSFFQVLSACTLSVDAWQAITLLLLIPTATAGLFWQQISREAETFGQPLAAHASKPYRRLVMAMCWGAIPINLALAAAMFMIFPRLAFRGAFAGLGSGRSGYSEQVNLAQTGVLNMDNSAVLWLQITPVEDRAKWNGYLRGGTLDYFDGKTWGRSRSFTTQTLIGDSNGVFKIVPAWTGSKGLRQTVTLVNTAGTTLFGSPTVAEITAPLATLQFLSDGSVHWTSGWRKPLRYEVRSFDALQSSVATPVLNPRLIKNYLQLPAVSLKRIERLSHQIAKRRSPEDQAKAIEAYLRTHYTYSLELGSQSANNPVDDFLFVRRRGPCGHFASAMAVMLRLEGIPARVAAGYYKGAWNESVGQYLLRERDAHAWVEAYFPKEGWVLFDPSPRTPVVAEAQRWVSRVQQNWEYLNFQWDRLVIEYDLYSQVKAVEDIQSNTNRMNARIGSWVDQYLMGRQRPDSGLRAQDSEIKTAFPIFRALTILLIVLPLVIFWNLRKRMTRADPAIAFYQKFLAQMARKGFPKSVAETGWEYAERLAQQMEPAPVHDITRRYYLSRFAKRP